MRRADRLFRLVQLLRRGRVRTASQLARELQVSERTIYRDVDDLSRSGVPIRGEAGVGYALAPHFDLPPLMFSPDEIEALVLGARIVASWSDRALGAAARSAVSKVEAVLPDALKSRVDGTSLFAPRPRMRPDVLAHLAESRAAIAERRKMQFTYTTPDGASTQRLVQPVGLFFWGAVWTLVAWCDLRGDFRSFRLDRMQDVSVLAETFDDVAGRTLEDFFRYVAAHAGERHARKEAV